MAESVFAKRDEIRLRTLQRLMVQRIPEDKRNSRFALLLNPANLIVLLVGMPAATAIIIASIEVGQLALGIVGLAVQTSAILIFFALPKLEKIAGRVVLGFYVGMYTYLMMKTPEAHGIFAMVMFMHPAFAYVVAGYLEALLWSNLLTILIAVTGIYHLSERPELFSMSGAELTVTVAAMFAVTLFIHAIDMVAKFSSADLRRQTHSLERANAKYDFVLNSIGDGFVATDENGIIEFISESTLKLTGFQRSELIGVHLSSALMLTDAEGSPVPGHAHPLTAALNDNKDIHISRASETHYNLLKADKTSFPVGFTLSPINVASNISGAVMIFHDMSAEEQIDRAKSEFVSLASHQLRTPLNVISWYSEKLRRGRGGDLNEKGNSYVEEIEVSSKRMIELVAAILNVSRIELGKLKIKYSDVDIVDLAHRLVKEVKPLAEQENIAIEEQYMADSHILENSDVEHTTVIVQNLLSNAVKYTNKDGFVFVNINKINKGVSLSQRFNLTAPKDGIVFSVKDNGIGIPKEQHDQIFGKLFRAENAQSTAVNGTGLGLYVTKSMVEHLGGSIWFESEANQGTTFFVYLPTHNERSGHVNQVTKGKIKL